MRYINKATHQFQGNQIIDRVLDTAWVEDQNQFVNANYDDGLCNNQQLFYREFTAVLLGNQQHYCCYCMKYIDFDDTTLEHIIPHKTKTQDIFDSYLICAELNDHVMFSKYFDRTRKLIPPAKYPHDIAYFNLVASCDSNVHCNHYRSSKFIRPLFYDNGIANKVQYNFEGIAYCTEYDEELRSVGVSTNADLRAYRKAWKILAETKDSLDEINDDDIDNVVFELIDHPYYERLLNNLTGENNKKELFKRYHWFFQYYKHN